MDDPWLDTKVFLKLTNVFPENIIAPKLKVDLGSFVRSCRVCTAHQVEQSGLKDQMTPQPKATRPWEIVANNIMGPFPRSVSGYTFILVVVNLYYFFL